METESDRLAAIQALGGQLVTTDTGSFWAIFDNNHVTVQSDTGHQQDDSAPQLTMRTSDAERAGLQKGTILKLLKSGALFVVRDAQPDGTGMSTIILDDPS